MAVPPASKSGRTGARRHRGGTAGTRRERQNGPRRLAFGCDGPRAPPHALFARLLGRGHPLRRPRRVKAYTRRRSTALRTSSPRASSSSRSEPRRRRSSSTRKRASSVPGPRPSRRASPYPLPEHGTFRGRVAAPPPRGTRGHSEDGSRHRRGGTSGYFEDGSQDDARDIHDARISEDGSRRRRGGTRGHSEVAPPPRGHTRIFRGRVAG